LIDWTSTFDGFLDRLEAEGGARLAPSGDVVVTATAFDKAGVGDVWYASAVTTANAVIDEWKRVNDK